MILLKILEGIVFVVATAITINNIMKIHLLVKINDYTNRAVDIIRNYKGYYKIYISEMSSKNPNKTILWEIINKRLFVDDIANVLPEARIVSDICRRTMRNVFVTFSLKDGTESTMIDLYMTHSEDIDTRLLDAINMLGYELDEIDTCTIYEKHKSTQTFSLSSLKETYNKQHRY